VVLLVGQAMASMDASILVVAAPSLRSSLHASGAELQLILATYTLTFGALVVSGARLGDVLGKRRAFVVGLAAFTICSLAGGLAPDPGPLIVARAFQGAAAALMTPQVLSIIQVQFDGERRARAIGAYSMILAVGVAAGQILGGLLVTAHLAAAAWRPALLVNAPIGAPLLLASRRVLPPMGACRQAAARPDRRVPARSRDAGTGGHSALGVPTAGRRGAGCASSPVGERPPRSSCTSVASAGAAVTLCSTPRFCGRREWRPV
jgi:MFS family permease